MSSKESCNLVFWAPKWGMIVGPGAITCSFFGLIALEHPGVCVWTMLMGIVITFLEWGNAPCCYKVTKAPAKMHALFLSAAKMGNYFVRGTFYILASIIMFFHSEPLQILAGVAVMLLAFSYWVAGYQGGSAYDESSSADYRNMDSKATGSDYSHEQQQVEI